MSYLGCDVVGRATRCVQKLECLVVTPTVQVRQAKVRNLHVSRTVQEDVLRLEVPVADSLRVAILHTLQQLPKVEPGLVLREFLARYGLIFPYTQYAEVVPHSINSSIYKMVPCKAFPKRAGVQVR